MLQQDLLQRPISANKRSLFISLKYFRPNFKQNGESTLYFLTSFRIDDAGMSASNKVRNPALAPPYLLTAAIAASKAPAPISRSLDISNSIVKVAQVKYVLLNVSYIVVL